MIFTKNSICFLKKFFKWYKPRHQLKYLGLSQNHRRSKIKTLNQHIRKEVLVTNFYSFIYFLGAMWHAGS